MAMNREQAMQTEIDDLSRRVRELEAERNRQNCELGDLRDGIERAEDAAKSAESRAAESERLSAERGEEIERLRGELEQLRNDRPEVCVIEPNHPAWKAIDDDDWGGATFANYLQSMKAGQAVSLVPPVNISPDLIQRMQAAFESVGCKVTACDPSVASNERAYEGLKAELDKLEAERVRQVMRTGIAIGLAEKVMQAVLPHVRHGSTKCDYLLEGDCTCGALAVLEVVEKAAKNLEAIKPAGSLADVFAERDAAVKRAEEAERSIAARAEQAHIEERAKFEALQELDEAHAAFTAVAEAIGVVFTPEGAAVQPGPPEKVVEQIRAMLRTCETYREKASEVPGLSAALDEAQYERDTARRELAAERERRGRLCEAARAYYDATDVAVYVNETEAANALQLAGKLIAALSGPAAASTPPPALEAPAAGGGMGDSAEITALRELEQWSRRFETEPQGVGLDAVEQRMFSVLRRLDGLRSSSNTPPPAQPAREARRFEGIVRRDVVPLTSVAIWTVGDAGQYDWLRGLDDKHVRLTVEVLPTESEKP